MTDTKKTSGLTRRQALAGAAGIFVGGVVAKVADEATKERESTAVERAIEERTQRLAIALNKTGGDWSVGRDGKATLTTTEGSLRHKQELSFLHRDLVSYRLTTTLLDEGLVNISLDYKNGTFSLPSDAVLEPGDKKNMEALIQASDKILAARRDMPIGMFVEKLEEIIPGLPVPMSAVAYDGAIKIMTREKGNVVPRQYFCIDKGSRDTRPRWIVSGGEAVDQGFVTRGERITGSNDPRMPYDWDYLVGTKRKVPEVTGEPSGDLRKDMIKKAGIMYEHGALKVEQQPGLVTQGWNKIREWAP